MLLVFSLFLLFIVFCLSSFKFICVVILLEVLNMMVLVYCYDWGMKVNLSFLVFLCVATMEVMLGLVSLTRVWDLDSMVI